MLNQCQFIGNLGKDTETRTFGNGNKVCSFSIAVTEKWRSKDTGEKKEATEWVNVDVFSEGLIRICEQYLKKGSKVFVSGKMKTRKYQDQSGNDKYATSIVLQGFDSKLVMLGDKSGNSSGGQGNQGGGDGYGAGGGPNSGGIDDDLPFAASWK